MFYDNDFIEENKNLCLSDRMMLDRWASQSPASVPMDNLSEKAKNAQVGCWECSVFPKMVENEPCQIWQKKCFYLPLSYALEIQIIWPPPSQQPRVKQFSFE